MSVTSCPNLQSDGITHSRVDQSEFFNTIDPKLTLVVQQEFGSQITLWRIRVKHPAHTSPCRQTGWRADGYEHSDNNTRSKSDTLPASECLGGDLIYANGWLSFRDRVGWSGTVKCRRSRKFAVGTRNRIVDSETCRKYGVWLRRSMDHERQ